jgi:peptidoglycan hydrolase-like protein with peptidoglycan-binding domain
MTKYVKNIINLILSISISIGGSLIMINDIRTGDVLGVSAIPVFSMNYLMNDETFRSSDIFIDENSIQQYLEKEKSPLQDFWDSGHRASYWIFNAANGNTSSKYGVFPHLNPAMILAYLEKEQSLVSFTNYDTLHDPENRIKFAMGYGCADQNNCDKEYQGFANQVNWATFQLQFNFNKSKDNSDSDNFKVGKTITTLDGYNVFLSNAATAANYRYTPHVYWGNYSLWKVIVGNGWGQSRQHYYYADLDNANLNTKTEVVIPTPATNDRENVQDLINKKFKFGDESEEIRTLQKFLKNKGYFTYPTPTGVYGSWTDSAREAYLKDQKKTGGNKKDCSSMFKQNWIVGETSEQIKELQQCLKDAGVFNHPSITGYFGPVTNQALQTILNKNVGINNSCDDLKKQNWTFGETSTQVEELQKCMQTAGKFNHKFGATGYFGEVTKKALIDWRGWF